MTEPRTDPTKLLKLRLRVKRGVVAGYIHEISDRHHRHERIPYDVPRVETEGEPAPQRA